MRKRIGIYCLGRYFIALSMISFVGIPFLLFHYETRTIEQLTRHDVEKKQRARSVGAGLIIVDQNTSSYGITVYPSVKKNREETQQPSKPVEPEMEMSRTKLTSETEKQFEKTDQSDRKLDLCPESRTRTAGFVEVQRETLVYSAWFDNRKSQHFIRVMMLSSLRNTPSTFCHFKSGQETFASEIKYYPHNENHQLQFGTFIASCLVPMELNNIPCFVNISTASIAHKQSTNNTAVLPVGLIDLPNNGRQTSWKYGICIPPLHGQISVEWLIEFLELSQILGASHFTFYDFAASDRVKESLKYYEHQGLVSVLLWNLPSYMDKQNIHYFGQALAIMDCLYRSMSVLHFVAFNDLDEFIVPAKHDNMTALLQRFRETEHCGHCFHSAIFDPSWHDYQDDTEHVLLTQRAVSRTSEPVPMWTKCVVDPRRIFEQGIHHISKQIEEKYTPAQVDWEIGRVFHYRRCHDPQATWQPRCVGIEVDKTMHKFGERLWGRIEMVIRSLSKLNIEI